MALDVCRKCLGRGSQLQASISSTVLRCGRSVEFVSEMFSPAFFYFQNKIYLREN